MAGSTGPGPAPDAGGEGEAAPGHGPGGPTAAEGGPWPAELSAVVRLARASARPTCVVWGPERQVILNAAARAVLDDPHAADGRGPAEIRELAEIRGFAEIRGLADTELARAVERAFAGEAAEVDGVALRLVHDGAWADRFVSISCTPVHEAGGQQVAGAFCVLRDTTEQVRETHRAALRLALSEAFLSATTEDDAMDAASALLGAHLDADAVGISEADAAGEAFTIRRDWTSERGRSVVGTHRLDDFGPDMVASLRGGRTVHVPDIGQDGQTAAFESAFAALDFRAFVAAPILRGGRLAGTTFALARRPRRWTEGDIALVAEVGQRLWAALEARRASAALRESERQLHLALEAARAGTFLIPADGAPPTVTDGARELFGFDPGQTPAVAAFLDRVHPEDRERVASVIAGSLERGEGHFVEYRVRRPDGATRWIASRAEAESGASGRFLRGALIDITQRKEAEARNARLSEEAERAHALLTTLAETVDDLIYVKDADHRFRFANPATTRAVGRRLADMIGSTEADWAGDRAQADAIFANDRRVMETGAQERFEEAFDGPGGRRAYLSTKAPLRDGEGRVVGLVGVAKDITDRKRAEEALERERELLRTIFDSIPAMITLYDPQVNVLMLNREFERLTGWTNEAAGAADIMAEIYPDPGYRAEVQRFMEACEGWMDIRMRTRDGRELETMWANVALSDDRRVGLGLDISARKRAERHRQLLIAELDHRVKNTLAVVQSLARQSFRAVPAAEAATGAFEGRLRALAAAHDLLTQAGWESAGLRELAAASVTAATARSWAVRQSGPDVLLSPRQAVALGMAFHELSTNASKHGALARDGGRVDLVWSVREAEEGQRRLRLEWREAGGPDTAGPAGQGFGARLLEQLLPRDLRGTAELIHGPEGTRWLLDAPLDPGSGGPAAEATRD